VDGSLYVRTRRAIAARVVRVPAWAEHFVATGEVLPSAGEEEEDDEDENDDETAEAFRIEVAAETATALRLASTRSSGERMHFTPTPAGRAWLAGAESERLRAVLSVLRALPQRNPVTYDAASGADFFGAVLPFQVDGTLDLRAALSVAFLSLSPGVLVPVAEFVRYHAQERNPFLGPDGPTTKTRSYYWSSQPITVEGWEAAWRALLLTFLARRLVPLGCATLGRMTDGALAFGLSGPGRYLLGEAESFDLAPEPGGGEVVVQPDFAIVFLAPAPRAEAELGRIAERTGAGVGALFRLTRASVLRAAEQGMTDAQVLATLESASRGGVPANVARQVRDWMQSVRTVRIAPAVLVECPDAETAGRVRALGGKLVTPVSPTVLRLEGDKAARAALVKRLRERAIFVGAQEHEPPSDPRGRSGGRGRPGHRSR
jgi:hypothetical protein